MRYSWPSRLVIGLAVVALGACGAVGASVHNNQNGNQNGNQNQNTNYNPADAGPVGGLVHVKGVVWSPGADLSTTLENNRFPIPGAAVIAYPGPPPEMHQGTYCNECVEIPTSAPNAITEVDGSFQLDLLPNVTYYLTIQKGEFRRVTQYTTPDAPDEVWEISYTPGQARPAELTLPAKTDLNAGDNAPKIGVIHGMYEDMSSLFDSLGMTYGGMDVVEVSSDIIRNASELQKYNVLIVTCGDDWSGTDTDTLRSWVEGGGKLYVDDFNYDFVEQVWPDFLSWYQEDDNSFNGGMGACGEGSPGMTGECNNWSEYDFNGDPGDPTFAQWLAVPDVNRGSSIYLVEAWDYLYNLGEGIVGVADECPTPHCGPNGEVYMEPKVWMYNNDGTSFANHPAATVSWPYYCGKVLYTVYHTTGGMGDTHAELLLQEKIMMYLIMEIQTCSSGPVVQ